ncbi:MAG: cation-transporting P-type ATPase [Eubacteriaceae bacterium]|nr:cation-transporting P-type ATPase [Eubacteriaceae bacterium]MDK2904155.1 cation-transporting P-type ATPase [Eubacteriaceae bacterium]MDK2936536.1 cation-transporting P-type ATPase [Eubacteriaceae bacterium]
MANKINPATGLTGEQVEERIKAGQVNHQPQSKTRTVSRIIRENTLTLFNLLNLFLALLVFCVGSYKNLLFFNIVVINTIIGIVQEIKAKSTVDQLTLIAQPMAQVLRDGKMQSIPFENIVLDDIIILKAGNQIPADAVVLEGELEVNEALLTGESDTILKEAGQSLLSGSFIVSGQAYVSATAVGSDNYASQLIDQVKSIKESNSEIMRSLRLIVRVVGALIVPIGLLLFYKQIFVQDLPIETAVVSVVAALIGMIPQGLVLLTSVALAVGVIRLGHNHVLISELYAIETLARVDVLCLDKTGTITEGVMEVLSVETLLADKDPIKALRAIVANVKDENPTAQALKESCSGQAPSWNCDQVVHFSSDRKWSGAHFIDVGSYVIGAPEIILKDAYEEIRNKVEGYAKDGQRVLCLCHSEEAFGENSQLPGDLSVAALILLGDKIRKEAKKTLDFFKNQGVAIKVISGDHPVTVSQIARRAGLAHWESYIDCKTLETDEDVAAAAFEYSVFGRVSPDQKQLIIKTLKANGHTVAMTGDGVNDILALREADCSIAMATGSDAVRQVSQVVLLDSNFSGFTRVLMEGRRVINNISRAASLFLVKTLFSLLLAIILIVANQAYPFVPIQLTLIGSLTTGIPSVYLALEPNRNRVSGNFLETVLRKALPGAMAIVLNVLLIMFVGERFGLSYAEKSTLSVIATGITGLVILFRVSKPFTGQRLMLFMAMVLLFAGAVFLLYPFFYLLSPLSFSPPMYLLMGINLLLIYPIMLIVVRIIEHVEAAYIKRSEKNKR